MRCCCCLAGVCVCGGGGEVFDCFNLIRAKDSSVLVLFFLELIVFGLVKLTCIRTRSIIRSISCAGHGRTSETARSATQNRVRSWWSSAADSGLAPAPWSTEARMSSMSMVGCARLELTRRGAERRSWSGCGWHVEVVWVAITDIKLL